MRRQLPIVLGVVAVAAVLLASTLPSYLHRFHSEEMELYSPNMMLIFFEVPVEFADFNVPSRFSVSSTMSVVYLMMSPSIFHFKGNSYSVFLVFVVVTVNPLDVGPRANMGAYVTRVFSNDTRVTAIFRGYGIPSDFIEVDYSFQVGGWTSKSLVTLKNTDGNTVLAASVVYSTMIRTSYSMSNNYYHLVGNNLTVAHRSMYISLQSTNAMANVTFPVNSFLFNITGVNSMFNTFYCSVFGDFGEWGEIGWLNL